MGLHKSRRLRLLHQSESRPLVSGTWICLGYFLVLLLFLYQTLPIYSTSNRLLAFLVFVVGTFPLTQHIRQRKRTVPLIEIPLATYPVLFAFPLFHQSEHSAYALTLIPVPSTIDKTLLSVLIAMVSLLIGYHIAKRGPRTNVLSRSYISNNILAYFAASLIIANILIFALGTRVPSGISQIVVVLLSKDLGIAILSFLYFQDKLKPPTSIILWLSLGSLTLIGFASGMAQSALQPLFVFALCRWVTIGKAPLLLGSIVLLLIFILQPVKSEYRERVWLGEQRNLTTLDKAELYLTIISEYWLHNKDNSQVIDSIQGSANQRMSLLLHTQQYVELTPSQISYKKGESIGYLFYGWIPRFIWKSKPSAHIANQQYPVEYGIQNPRTLSTTSIGVGHVAEGYINFGMLGIIPLFLLLGFISRIPMMLFPENTRNIPALSIQCYSTLQMMIVGSSIGGVYGGLITAILSQTVMFVVLSKLTRSEATN